MMFGIWNGYSDTLTLTEENPYVITQISSPGWMAGKRSKNVCLIPRMIYYKNHKNLDTQNKCVIILKLEQFTFTIE